MPLEKAKMLAIDNEADDIEFMFNPAKITFKRDMQIEQAEGSHTETGDNKTSFKHPNPYTLTVNGIILDTYEDSTSVLTHIKKFSQSVEFTKKGKGAKKRPPIYLFTWGAHNYLRCFVKTFSFDLTLFLPDGTPVRAKVDLSLEQIEVPNPTKSQSASNPNQSTRAASGDILFG